MCPKPLASSWALGKIAEVVRLIEEDRQMDHFVEHGVTKTLISVRKARVLSPI